MSELEEFLRFMFNEGWNKLEGYFYNVPEDRWVEVALEKFEEWKESKD